MRNCDNLDILLDPPDVPTAVHTSGDRITGLVRLFNGHKLDIDRISIHFKGKTKSRVVTGSGDNRRVHLAKGILFDLRQDLTPPNITVTPSFLSYTWSFGFEIPWESQYAEQPGSFAPHENFEHEPGFPLPPSLNPSADNAYQAIYYYLEVVANDRRATFFHKKKSRLLVNFAPSRPTLAPLSPSPFPKTTMLSRCTKKLDSELLAQEKQLTIAQKARRLFSESEPKPIAYFSISSTVPYQLIIGEPFPIFLGIRHDLTRSTAPQPPAVTLTNINARLTSHSHGRVPYKGFFNPGQTSAYYVTRDYKIYFCNRSLSIPMYENMNLSEHLADIKIPHGLAPSFKTYNITRRYELKVTADLICVGEKYKITLSSEHGMSVFKLLPKLCRSRFDDAAERTYSEEQRRIQEGLQATERSLPVSDEDVEWLPAYEEVVSEAPPFESRRASFHSGLP